jgi:hypothetical protein
MSRWQVPDHFKVMIGGNTYIDCPTIINYKGQSLFELRRSDNGFLGMLVPRAELVINKKIAGKLKIEIPAEALKAANRVF